jgi:molybdate transport system regulatory protein
MKSQPVFSLALEGDKRTVLDQTDARLLRYTGETSSLSKAAKICGFSYRNAWGRVKQLEKTLGSGYGGQGFGQVDSSTGQRA